MGILDGLFGSGGSSDRNKAIDTIKNVPLPILKEYYPELYRSVVELNPEVETAVNLGPSEMAGVATDPALRQAQLDALGKLTEIGDAGGRDAQFLADAARIESDVNTNLAGQMGAIEQEMAMKGMSGGMSEMVAKNLAAQGGANRQAQMNLDENAQAQKRALDSIMNAGNLGGQLRSQDFSEAAKKAEANDAISKFNAQNQQQVIRNNVNTRNNAQAWNAQNQQSVANQNTDTKNKAQQYNLGISQQQFDNEMAKAAGVAGAYGDKANSKDKERDEDKKFVGGIISAGSQLFGG